MDKKIFTVIILALLLSLVSCGDSNIGKPYPKDEKEEVTTVDKEKDNKQKTNFGSDSTKQEDSASNDAPSNAKKDSLKESKPIVKLTTQQLQERVENLDTIVGNHSNKLIDIEEANKRTAEEIDNCVFCKYGTKAYVVSILILIVLIVIVSRMVLDFSKLSPEEEEKEFDQLFTKCVSKHYINENLRELFRDIETLRGEKDEQSKRIKQLENQIGVINSRPGRSVVLVPQPAGTTAIEPRIKIFYLGAPSKECEFIDNRNPSGNKYYKFTLDTSNPQKAFFEFTANDATAMQQAINSRNEIIEWACISKNNPEVPKNCYAYNYSKGEATLSNGVWSVTKKQEVIYG